MKNKLTANKNTAKKKVRGGVCVTYQIMQNFKRNILLHFTAVALSATIILPYLGGKICLT